MKLSIGNKVSAFQDAYGNVLPNSWDFRSENPLTFNAAYYMTRTLLYRYSLDRFTVYLNNTYSNQMFYRFYNKYTTNKGTWRTMEHDPNPSWSIDEKISTLAFLSLKKELSVLLIKVPYLPSKDNTSYWSWFRPDVMAYHIGCRYRFLRPIIWYTIILPKIWLSMWKFKTKRHSSGVQLAFIMAMGWKRYKWIDRNKITIAKAMDVYYIEEEHPTAKMWGEIRREYDVNR